VAAIRPEQWNLPLLLHVGGAMLLVSFLLIAAAALVGRPAPDDSGLGSARTRLGFRVLLSGALPAYVVMRGAAQWLEGLGGAGEPAWIEIGYGIADAGLLVLVVATVLAWLASRRRAAAAGNRFLSASAGTLTIVLLLSYVVAIWAMTTKPS
jgi:hypothetical protein